MLRRRLLGEDVGRPEGGPRRRALFAAAAACAVCLVAPGAASAAATITWSPEEIVVTADESGDDISLAWEARTEADRDTGEEKTLYEGPSFFAPEQPLYDDRHCGPANDASEAIVCKDAARVRFVGGASRDDFTIDDRYPVDKVVEMAGNGGDDQIRDAGSLETYSGAKAGRRIDGGDGNDKLLGHGGNDQVLGGAGNDELQGGGGSDVVLGGEGNDDLSGEGSDEGTTGGDVLDGGPGLDIVDEWRDNDGPPATVSLDGVANDGYPGEGDNVTAVEDITSLYGTFILSDAAEKIVILSERAKDARVEGRGGDDVIETRTGADTIDAGAGADTVSAGFGNDTITGGPGRDNLLADQSSAGCGFTTCEVPAGNDRVDARDGEVDSIDCGPGTDTVLVDPNDVVSNCENVDRGGTACCSPPGPDPNVDPDPTGQYSLEILSKLSVRQIASKGLRVRVSCPAACSLKASVLVDKSTARRLKLGKSRRLAARSGSRTTAGNTTLTLKVGKKAKARFKRLRRPKLSLVVVATRPSDGKSQKLTRSLRLGK